MGAARALPKAAHTGPEMTEARQGPHGLPGHGRPGSQTPAFINEARWARSAPISARG